MKYLYIVLLLLFVIVGCDSDGNNSLGNETGSPISAPLLQSPADGSITGNKPVLIVENVERDFPDSVFYTFQIAEDPEFTGIIRKHRDVLEGEDVTAWQVKPELDLTTRYWWRARAENEELTGAWMEIASFAVGDTATLIDPPDGAQILEFRPNFTVLDPKDVSKSGQLPDTFQVAEDPAFTYPIISDEVPRGSNGQTTFHPTRPFPYGRTFWWRVKVHYTEVDGIWSDPSRFSIINPEGDARNLTQQFVNEIESFSLAMSGWSRNSMYYEMERSDLIYDYSVSSSLKIQYSILGFAEQDDFLVENIDATFIWVRKSDGILIQDHGLWILTFVVEDHRWKIYSSFFYKKP